MKHSLFPFLLGVCLCAVPALGSGRPQPEKLRFYANKIVPHIVFGGTEWTTTLIMHNPRPDVPESFTLQFYGDAGLPLPTPINGRLVTELIVSLAPNETKKLQTDYRPDIAPQWGWVWVHEDWMAEQDFSYTAIYAIFRQRIAGREDREATVTAEWYLDPMARLVYDQTGGYIMGVALANPESHPLKINVLLRNQYGASIGRHSFYLDAKAHIAFSLAERYPVTRGLFGSADFDIEGLPFLEGIAGIGLRFNPNGSFTSVPLIWTDDSRP